MSMENQVTSIEQSQRLLELGVPTEKASMVWNICRAKWSLQEWHLEYTPVGGRCVGDETSITQTLPAFTVADLLGMLPFNIEFEGVELYVSFIYDGISKSLCVCYESVEYGGTRPYVYYETNTMVSSIVHCIEWLSENGYKLNLKTRSNEQESI